MTPTPSFRRFTAVAAVVSTPLAFACLFFGLLATRFNLAAFGNPGLALAGGTGVANFTYWSMLLDMFGYYLLLIPLTVYLHLTFRTTRHGQVTVYSICGLGYSMIGASGAAVLAVVWPTLITGAATSTGIEHNTAVLIFRTLSNAVDRGLWNTLELTLAGVWWIGIGLEIRRARPALGVVTIVLGGAALLDMAGTILGLEAMSMPGLVTYLLLAPVWATWCALSLDRLAPIPAGRQDRGTTEQRRLRTD